MGENKWWEEKDAWWWGEKLITIPADCRDIEGYKMLKRGGKCHILQHWDSVGNRGVGDLRSSWSSCRLRAAQSSLRAHGGTGLGATLWDLFMVTANFVHPSVIPFHVCLLLFLGTLEEPWLTKESLVWCVQSPEFSPYCYKHMSKPKNQKEKNSMFAFCKMNFYNQTYA